MPDLCGAGKARCRQRALPTREDVAESWPLCSRSLPLPCSTEICLGSREPVWGRGGGGRAVGFAPWCAGWNELWKSLNPPKKGQLKLNRKLNTKLVQATSPINPLLVQFIPAPHLLHEWGFTAGEFSHRPSTNSICGALQTMPCQGCPSKPPPACSRDWWWAGKGEKKTGLI